MIHTKEINNTIASYKVNRVLSRRASPINKAEVTIPYETRFSLAQLSSGFFIMLISGIDSNIQDCCPKFIVSSHDTLHLLKHRLTPAALQVVNLWTNFIQVLKFNFKPQNCKTVRKQVFHGQTAINFIENEPLLQKVITVSP